MTHARIHIQCKHVMCYVFGKSVAEALQNVLIVFSSHVWEGTNITVLGVEQVCSRCGAYHAVSELSCLGLITRQLPGMDSLIDDAEG